MGLTIIKDLPSERNISRAYPLTEEHRIAEHRDAVNKVITGDDKRLMLVIGPCSAWPFEAVAKYSERLARVSEELRDRLLLVLRTYIQKPRTTIGWPGPLNQPDPLAPVDIEQGILQCRKMMIEAAKLHPLADEMLFTHNAPHFAPLLSYIALGARSAEDSEHRHIASGFDCAVGVKNGTSGDIQVGANGVLSVQNPHVLALHNQQVQTDGNPYAHLILRGGNGRSNYDDASIAKASQMLMSANIQNPAIVVDASHDNCLDEESGKKDPLRQPIVLQEVLQGKLAGREGYDLVRGFMVESFLQSGNQKIRAGMDLEGLSVTDPCIGWEQTEQLLRETADAVDALENRSVYS